MTLSALDDILAETQDAARRKAAEKSAQRLKLMEIQALPPTIKQLGGDIYKVVLSFFDGTGSRLLWFSRYMGKDKANVELVNLMLRTGAGAVDCYGSKPVPVVEFNEMIEEL